MSVDGAAYSLWQDNTTETSAVFSGQEGSQYRFFSVLSDNVGHQELVPEQPDAVTLVVTTSWQNPLEAFDVDGNGNVEPLDVLTLINHINKHPDDPSLLPRPRCSMT